MATITVDVGGDVFEVTLADARANNGAARLATDAGIDPLWANGNPKPTEKLLARAFKRLLIQASKSVEVATAVDAKTEEANTAVEAIESDYAGELAEGGEDD